MFIPGVESVQSRPRELLCRCRGSAAAALSSGSVAAVLSSGSATAALWTVQIQMESGGEIQMDSGGDPDGLRRRDLVRGMRFYGRPILRGRGSRWVGVGVMGRKKPVEKKPDESGGTIQQLVH